MQDINIQMKQRNPANTDWDNLYPKTKAILVIDSDGNTMETHVDDTVKHITSAERTAWNAKQVALAYTPENVANKAAANGYASLGSDGKIPSSQLPAIAISDTFVVATQVAMLALTAEVGDIAVRTDLSKSFILKTAGATVLANWQELVTPTDTVLSVNSQTGAITLTTTNLAEGTNKYYTEVRVSANTDVAAAKAHAGSTHAPTDAQKNSDITKTEIEAKLIGTITSHTHSSGTPTAHKATHLSGGSDALITISSTAPASPIANELFYEILA